MSQPDMSDRHPSSIFQPVRVSIDYLPESLTFADLDRVITTGALSVHGLRRRSARLGLGEGGSSRIREIASRPGERTMTVFLEATEDGDLRMPYGSRWGGTADFTMEVDDYGYRVLWQMVHGYSGISDEAAAIADARVAHRLADVVCAGLQELKAPTRPGFGVSGKVSEALQRSGVSLAEARTAVEEEGERFWSYVAPNKEGLAYPKLIHPGHLLWLEGGEMYARSADDEDTELSPWMPVAGELDGTGPIEDLRWVVVDPGTPRPDDATLDEATWSIIRRPAQSTSEAR